MTRRWMIPAIALAALAVTVQNILYFTGEAEDTSAGFDLDGDEEDALDSSAATRSALEAVPAEDALAFVSNLPDPERARNPFLTRLEYDALLGAGPRDERAGGGLPSLDGTLYSSTRRVAWLDGSPVSEGDRIAGFELVRIEKHAVELRNPLRELRIELDPFSGDGEADPTEDEETSESNQEDEP